MQVAIKQAMATSPIRKQENIVSRKVRDTYFLIDITDNYAQDKCALYEINETGYFIWNQINGKNTVKDIALELQRVIIDEIDLQILIDDVAEFVDVLLAKGFAEV